ncbi:TraB/GumN family protein [Paramaledivibacter caminithermalis]|uniref:Pheromone shutdown-related protein TraB n=1 Tax=Paramaledivibacter caminithermalis (strain DSM 15212 / CIP 107654 / DViRD3) TaxID=1121301 RepID=A0A1M6RL28_PARC5|nr:TraB/GumN family protein [Paramaledivibacter caminithermalis]SHK33152.1 pheromone shutdown-related protein TraB [Paramaledivibacter caminithermalis DSM 15212]
MASSNIHKLSLNDKKIVLIGTAHVSQNSVNEVKKVIEGEQPDSVCVELCEERYNSLQDKDRWANMDIIKIIKEKKALLFLTNLIMASYQKKIAKQLGINPGQEMVQGIESAREANADIVLADRNIEITFRRILANLRLWDKIKLLFQLIYSIFDNEEISEEDLDKLKSEDMLNLALDDMTKSMPRLKTALVDERDKYLAQKIKEAPGEKIVAVLGAAHIPGVKREIFKENDLKDLKKLPKQKNIGKYISWGIPIIIILLIASTFLINRDIGTKQVWSWILWNGSLSAIGAAIAVAHPLSIITAFLAAPISSLNPLVAAGWFAGLVEVLVRKPNVKEFQNLSNDILSFKGFWKNKVTRTLLVVVLANLGSVLGTVISGTDIVRLFINSL